MIKDTLSEKNHERSLSEIQSILKSVEGVFYHSNRSNKEIEYLKLNVHSRHYDKKYDEKVRRKSLNLIYILSEILADKSIHSDTLDKMDDLENYIFSPEFYRCLILNVAQPELDRVLNEVISAIKNDLRFFDENVDASEYGQFRERFLFLNPPKAHSMFVEELHQLRSVMQSVGQMISGESA